MKRRDFLRGMAAALLAPKLVGCSGPSEPGVLERFPQGVASGEPKPDGVVLWTRVAEGTSEDVTWEVASDSAFADVRARGVARADPEHDRTVHVVVTGLEARTVYFYRFTASGLQSMVGRTKTAPRPDDDVPVRFAYASCQDYVQGYFHSWRALREDADVDFVVFLGDYVYEYETGSDATPQARGAPASPRSVDLPDGLVLTDPVPTKTAVSLADYRTLYRATRSDPDLQAVHQAYPFVFLFDDHEFANDAWQDHANDFNGAHGDEHEPDRWRAAFRAWLEYSPLTGDPRPPDQLTDLRVYRSLRFGRALELFLTDQRTYRSDHVVPEGPINLAVGKTEENSALGSRTLAKKDGFDALEAASDVTMLGADQRAWLLDGIRRSDARWKVWASQLLVSQFVADLRSEASVPERFRDRFYFKLDHWDGYRSERSAILTALQDVDGFVIVSGDLHGFYAAEVWPDFDAPAGDPMTVELTVGSISADTLKLQTQKLVASNVLLALLGLGLVVERFDEVLLAGNPHFRYANSAAYGVATVDVDTSAMDVRFAELDALTAQVYPGVARTKHFRVTGRRLTTIA